MNTTIIPPQLRKVRWTGDGTPKVVTLTGDVEEDSADDFSNDFSEALSSGQQEILVMIHSTGGCVYSALKIHDIIKSSPVPVTTCVIGAAMSAAAFIFTPGSKRYMAPHSTVMLHDVSVDHFAGKINDIVVETKEMKRLNATMWRLMAQNCNLPDDFFKKKLASNQNTDAYITPDSAKQWGLATHIGVPRLETRVSVSTHVVCGVTGTGVPGETTLGKVGQSSETPDGSPGEKTSPPQKVPRPKGRKPKGALRWDEDNGNWVMRKRKRGEA